MVTGKFYNISGTADEIPHHLIGSLPQYLQDFCISQGVSRISSINSMLKFCSQLSDW